MRPDGVSRRRFVVLAATLLMLGAPVARAADGDAVGVRGEVSSLVERTLTVLGRGGAMSTIELAPDWLAYQGEPIGRKNIPPKAVVGIAAEELGPPNRRGLLGDWFLVAGPEIPLEQRRGLPVGDLRLVTGLIGPRPRERVLVGEFEELRYDTVLVLGTDADTVDVKIGPEAGGMVVRPVERDQVRVGARVILRAVSGRTASVLLLPGPTR